MYDTAKRVALVKRRVHERSRRKRRRGYVLVAVVSFVAAAAITALCFRLRNRENQKKGGTDKPDQHKQEEKIQ